jgi:nucleotide-binding universal stress UspA family protein
MSFHRILIAVDGSPLSIDAARTGLELARALSAEVAIVHAVEPPVDYSGEIGIPNEVLLEAAGPEAGQIVASLEQSADLPPNTQQFIRVGHARDVIGRIAAEWSADLIVIGSHGRSGLGRVLLGSVAEAVVRHAACPVLITRTARQTWRRPPRLIA